MKQFWGIGSVLLVLLSCSDPEATTQKPIPQEQVVKAPPYVDKGPVEFMGLIDVQSINDQIFADLRYATDSNFMGFQLYETIKRPYLQPDVAERLSKCQDYLSEIDSSLHLLIYDASRPVSVH